LERGKTVNISPGVELVLKLATQETIAAELERILPENLFCGLLKYSELEEDGLGKVVSDRRVLTTLLQERDWIRELLKEYSIPSTRVRRQIRKELGHGKYHYKGGIIHRSDSSRKLFENAQRMADKENNILTPGHLLQAIIDDPTPVMEQVIGKKRIDQKGASKSARKESLPRYTRDFIRFAKDAGLAISGNCTPQVQGVVRVLKTIHNAPVMLICSDKVDVTSIIGCAFLELKDSGLVLEFDFQAIYEVGKSQDEVNSILSDLLVETTEMDNPVIFINLTKCRSENTLETLSAFKPAIKMCKPSLLIAIGEKQYSEVMQSESALVKKFQTVWIHKLIESKIPKEI
jgi:ATP-dependent Clp protease ATP-binding subunit ClpA